MINPLLSNRYKELEGILKNDFQSKNRKEQETVLLSMLDEVDISEYREDIAKNLIRLTKLNEVVPEIYREYRPVVYDGSLFLLLRLSSSRFNKILIDQFLLGEDVPSGERLIKLAQEMPTLQKLGQVIARNRKVNREFKQWLIHLENGMLSADLNALKKKIKREIKDKISLFTIQIGDKILSEASVAAVVPFTWNDPDSGQSKKGVFKAIKPNVTRHLSEELRLWDEMAIFFEKNRANYGLKDFRFIETFQDVKEAIEKEIHLGTEQANLKKACVFYRRDHALKIPKLFPISTKNVTSMELIEGGKITEVSLTKTQRRKCSEALFRAIIGHPLFSSDINTLFHGDPHAGNIYALKMEDEDVQIVLLDWSLIGHLSRAHRISILRLSIGILLKDEKQIYESINDFSEDNLTGNPSLSKKIKKEINQILFKNGVSEDLFLEKSLHLLDRIALTGAKFPRELLIFRKAIFTLKGVLNDIDPEFVMDTYMTDFIKNLLIQELPERWAYLFLPLLDKPDYYQSMISNADILRLGNHLLIEEMKKGMDTQSTFIEINSNLTKLLTSFLVQ